jgi:hypothetical protein
MVRLKNMVYDGYLVNGPSRRILRRICCLLRALCCYRRRVCLLLIRFVLYLAPFRQVRDKIKSEAKDVSSADPQFRNAKLYPRRFFGVHLCA